MARVGKNVLFSHYTTGYYQDFIFFDHGKGSKIYDVDGNEYIDFAMGLGPLIMGHAHPDVVAAVCKEVARGTVHGLGEPNEIRFAELMAAAIPGADGVAFCNSGTEATMHALKMARAFTGKEKIAKFEGCYHGTHDYAQVSSRFASFGPIEDPRSIPDFNGIPKFIIDNTLTLSINQPEALEKIRKYQDQLAAVIIEPVPLFCPLNFKDFLLELRKVTAECNVLLIFDEIVTGFRLDYHGAQGYFNIIPDLATYGKVIGGGLPVGAITGKKKIMNILDLSDKSDIKRKAYLTGTFNGNRIVCAAGIATLEFLKANNRLYAEMEQKVKRIMSEVENYAGQIKFPFQMKGISSIFVPYFHNRQIVKPRDTGWAVNSNHYNMLRKYMLKYNICLGDSGVLLLSTSHTDEDCDCLIKAFKQCLDDML